MYVFLKRTYTVHYTLYILFHLRGRVGCKWGLSMSLSIRGGRGPNRHMINYKIFLSECYQTRVNFYRSRSGWAVTIFPKFSHAFLNKSISPTPCTWWLVVLVAVTCSNFQPHKILTEIENNFHVLTDVKVWFCSETQWNLVWILLLFIQSNQWSATVHCSFNVGWSWGPWVG